MQFELQHRYFRERFPKVRFDLVLVDGEAVGRLYVHRGPEEIRIVDIALLPDHRGLGIGGRLVGDLIAEATRVGTPVRLHVERRSRALEFYARLGFETIGDTGVHRFMEWSPTRTVT